MAWSDEPWVVEGAAVRVSILGFDDGTQTNRTLDGAEVTEINTDLTSGTDLTLARPLPENVGLAFYGDVKAGPFDVGGADAKKLLSKPNTHGVPNTDVVRLSMPATSLTS